MQDTSPEWFFIKLRELVDLIFGLIITLNIYQSQLIMAGPHPTFTSVLIRQDTKFERHSSSFIQIGRTYFSINFEI